MNSMPSDWFWPLHFSCRCRRVNIMSVVGLPALKTLEEKAGRHFAYCTAKGDSSVVVAVGDISVDLVKGHDRPEGLLLSPAEAGRVV